jgi:hypothetical protein
MTVFQLTHCPEKFLQHLSAMSEIGAAWQFELSLFV